MRTTLSCHFVSPQGVHSLHGFEPVADPMKWDLGDKG